MKTVFGLSYYGTYLGIIFAIIASINCQCPPISSPCSCSSSIYEPIVIICDNAGSLENALGTLSILRDVHINTLVITNTSIPTLSDNAFRGLSINHIVLNRNSLTQINEKSFDDLVESLTELDLKDNSLGQVPQMGIPRLKRLRNLILARNRINTLPPRTFASYESRDYLSKIDLSGNQLASVEPSVFAGLKNLEEVSFEANQLSAVPTYAFTEQRQKLKNLNLGLNKINNVPPGALDFANLESLSLEFNGISNLLPETFRGVQKLLYLYLTGNKFPRWDTNMFRYLGSLRILGIGETPIRSIPSNGFQFIPSLVRLEMSEAAVDTIENGAFQKVPNMQAIIMNKNRLTKIRVDMFQGLTKLYTLDLSGNVLNQVDDRSWANLVGLRHLDISNNNLMTLPENTFSNTFLATASDTRVLYLCENPWVCDNRLEWFRRWLRQNVDIVIDKGLTCLGLCKNPDYLANVPLREDVAAPFSTPEGFAGTFPPMNEGVVPSNIGWIILAVILAILLASILLLAIARYFVSRKRKREKEDEDRILSSNASGYHAASVPGTGYPGSAVDLDLPPATSLYERQYVSASPYWTAY